MARGTLRIYLGFAPGSGTTYALLDEAHRRAGRGTDVVVAALRTHGRRATEALVGGLELVGTPRPDAEGGRCLDLDVGAVLARRPRVAVVDDLAAVDGADGVPRWQAVERLRDAGVDVVTTLDVSRIESLVDVVAAITDLHRGGHVPDSVVRSAEQIQLVDQTPEALRRRLAHGNIYPADRVDAALDQAFRPEALAELRELTMRWLADRVHESASTGSESSAGPDVREGILVALSGAPTSPSVLRRAARMADRQGARLVGVHVRAPDDVSEPSATLVEQGQLLEALGGRYLEVAGDDVADALVRVAVAERLTQIVVGASRRGRWRRLRHGALVAEVVRRSPVDVHVVVGTAEAPAGTGDTPGPRRGGGRGRRRPSLMGRRRRLAGWVLSLVLPAVMAGALVLVGDHLDLAAELILMLLAVLGAAAIGGLAAGTAAAVWAFVFANWCFIPPLHELSISNGEDALSLVAFLLVALVIGGYVSVAARRSAEATRARSDASALAALAGTAAGARNPLPAIVDRLRVAYGGVGATLFSSLGGTWVVLASAGLEPPTRPGDAVLTLAVGDDVRLDIDGTELRGLDPEVTAAFMDQLAVAVDRQRLRAAEEETRALSMANELRAAILASFSHDLRTPLATIKAASSTLVQLDEQLEPAARRELYDHIGAGVDRLTSLVVNLLDMSRIQAGAVDLDLGEVLVDEVVHRAVLGTGRPTASVDVDLPEDLPAVTADPAMLEQVVVNLVDNACKWSPPGRSVRVDAAVVGRSLHLRVVDHGPGIAPQDRERVLEPFERVDRAADGAAGGDTARIPGTGLGLAVAAGFCRLMAIDLRLGDTPGGGTTATLVIPLARVRAAVRAGS